MIGKTIHADERGVSTFYESTGRRTRFNYEISEAEPRKSKALNPVQQRMLDVLMKGGDAFKKEVLSNLSKASLDEIEKQYKRTQFVLQKLKYDTYYGPYDKFLNSIFRHLGVKEHNLLGIKHTDFYELPRSVTLNSLRITQTTIVETLIAHELLPKNFYEISTGSLEL